MYKPPDDIIQSKISFYLKGFIYNLTLKNYVLALTYYKMIKCISTNFDHEERTAWANILYQLAYQFKCMSQADSAAYCLDKALELCPDWADAQYARSCIITSPLESNSAKSNDEFYANDTVVENYLCQERIGFYSDFLNLCIQNGIVFENKDIMDAGCGPGVLLKAISERASTRSLTGFDFSSQAIKLAQQRCVAGNFFQADIYTYLNGTFDIVICTETLEHLLYPEKALQNLLGMTKNNGHLLLCVPNGRVDTFDGHINFWSPESWAVFIEKSCKKQFYIVEPLNDRHLIAVITKTMGNNK